MTNVSFISVSSPLIKFYFLTTKYFQIIYFICSSIVWQSVISSSYCCYHSLLHSPPQQNFRQLFFSFRKVRGCGCSFVAKLSWKKNFFFWKNICFLQNIHYLQKKIILYGKKKLYWFFFVYWKSFFYRKWKKYISHLRNIFLSRKYIFILQKKFFWS